MKSTGIVRKLDELGRVVLPIELRRTLLIGDRDPLEIHVEGEMIILAKYNPQCTICGSSAKVVSFREKLICRECIEDIKTNILR